MAPPMQSSSTQPHRRRSVPSLRVIVAVAVFAALARVQLQRPGATSWDAHVMDLYFNGFLTLDTIVSALRSTEQYSILNAALSVFHYLSMANAPYVDTFAAREGSDYAVPIRVYAAPKGLQPAPALVYFHGGGWVVGGVRSHHLLTSYIAERTNFTVISVDYRLAPEHRFPVPLNDCAQVVMWARENAASLGIDPTRIAVAGDSAGGNLAAAVALKLRETLVGEQRLWKQVLIFPAMDSDMFSSSMMRNKNAVLARRHTVMKVLTSYASSPDDFRNPLFSPNLSKDFRNLPPALSLLCEHDAILDSGLQYAEHLKSAGVPSKVLVAPTYHGFVLMHDLVPAARKYVDSVVEFLLE